MSNKIMKLVVDIQGNQSLVPADEIDIQRLEDANNYQLEQIQKAEQNAIAKKTILSKLGITEDEAKLLLSQRNRGRQ